MRDKGLVVVWIRRVCANANDGKEVGEIADTDVNVSREIASEKTFYVFYNASCGEKEGRADGDARASRDVAIFMKLSDGTIVCEDNQ